MIFLTETRVKDQPLANINLLNYSFVHAPPQSNAGGVAVYVSLNLKFFLDNNQHQLHNSESIWLNLDHHENKSPIRLAVYIVISPPPMSRNSWMTFLLA